MGVDTSDAVNLFVLVAGLFVLYRFVIPYLFPQAAHGVGVMKVKVDDDEVYAFEGGRMAFVTGDNRSQARANARRRKHTYEKAQV